MNRSSGNIQKEIIAESNLNDVMNLIAQMHRDREPLVHCAVFIEISTPTLEKLKEKGAYEVYQPDVVLYDVLGDVVCGGFTMPMRKGYADKVFIITSGENMAIHAGANIAMAVQNFKNRGYASLGGIILNRRNVKREEEKVQELADDFETTVVGKLTRSELVTDAEEQGKTLMECYPDSEMAEEYRTLTENILKICREDGLC